MEYLLFIKFLTDIEEEDNKLSIYMPKDTQHGYVNNTKEHFAFQFNKLFNMATKQEKIFDNMAKDVCDQALEGYSGKINNYDKYCYL